jgi:hypothetical protein
MDPSALGTLRIALDALAAEARRDTRSDRPARSRRTAVGLRVTLASALRRVADALEPSALREART